MTHSHGGSRLRRLREAADAVAVARANLDDSAIGDALRYSTECTACGERIGDTSTGAVDEVQPTLVGDMSDRRKLHVLTFTGCWLLDLVGSVLTSVLTVQVAAPTSVAHEAQERGAHRFL